MHVLARDPAHPALDSLRRASGRRAWLDRLRAWILRLAARLFSHRSFGDRWRVSLEGLEQGDVRVVLSVLSEPYAEMDAHAWPDGPPEDRYFDDLRAQIAAV